MRKKGLLILSLLAMLILFPGAMAKAESNPDPDEMAVYLQDKFYGNSAVVDGSIYSAGGDIQFTNSGSNDVTGNIYYKDGKSFILPKWYNPSFAARAIKLNETYFDGAYPDIIDYPSISNYVPTYDPQWNTPVRTVSTNTHFGTLNISGTGSPYPLIVDTSQGDVYIVADNISWGWNKSIKISGNGKLFLFIKNYSSSAPVQIENNNNPDSTYIFSKKSLSHSSMDLFAHVFYIGVSSLDLKGKITGSVVSGATSLKLEYGGDVVNGLVYTPKASASIQSPEKVPPLIGQYIPNIKGRLVAKSLNLTGNGRIYYDDAYARLSANLLPQFLKHEVKVTANNPEWGTVSPVSTKVNYGGTVQITATPNPGYKFTGYTSANGSSLPDGNGYLTVTGAVELVANFALDEPIIPESDYKNGILGAYYDAIEPTNPSALKMKRIDPNIAFNYGYEATPHESIGREYFSVRWTGYIRPEVSGDYIFKTYSDDGVKLTINNETILDNWGCLSLAYTVAQTPIHLEAGQYYPIKLEYQQGPLYAAVFLFWEAGNVPMSLVPEAVFFVDEDDYNEYAAAKYYNPLQKTGTGFTNKFYTPSDYEAGTPTYTEINNINYDWGIGAPGSIDTEKFFGVMEGDLEAKFTEDTTLVFTVDDAIRVFIDGEKVIDAWEWHSRENFTYTFPAVSGKKYHVRIEYADFGLGASCVMLWQGAALGQEVVPKEFMYPYE